VGADGANSTVAKLAGVEEYLGFDMTRAGYWSYWPKPACWDDQERYPYDALFAYDGDDLRYIFQTDDDLLLLVAAPPNAVARSWGGAHREKLVEFMRSYPETAPLVENNAPVGKTVGYVSGRFFYRRPIGPGFALVGDAGTYKDFVTGHGMTDAFLSAKRLAAAIVDGRDAAFVHYWRERDALTLPLFLDARRMGEVGFNDALTRIIVRHMGESDEIRRRLALVFDRKLSPFDVVSPMQIGSWVVREALRGRFESIGPFFSVGKRLGEYQKEIQKRQAMADEARATLAVAPAPDRAGPRFAAGQPTPAD
jgi:flavin-dependent dehydrogenase